MLMRKSFTNSAFSEYLTYFMKSMKYKTNESAAMTGDYPDSCSYIQFFNVSTVSSCYQGGLLSLTSGTFL